MFNSFIMRASVSALALSTAGAAFAQSTGSDTIEQSIVVTGSRGNKGVSGIIVPDVAKTRSILTQEFIARQPAGQSILNTINQIPGVNFTNTDPYGNSGGNLRIRGFPGNRISLLFDGLPLNDTGNYAIYSNQQLDPEIIGQVSVNLGTTDVDSPTPSAAGGVVAYKTIVPDNKFGVTLQGSTGSFDYLRLLGIVQTGDLTASGLRAFAEISNSKYDKFTNRFTRARGQLEKTQINARLYQPLANGDFLSLAVHYNRNRNDSYNSGTATDFATSGKNFDNYATCTRDTTPQRGVVDNDNAGSATNINNTASCTNFYGLRINPSNTGNVRGSARFTLSDHFVLTVDPGYQFTQANGGGTTALAENNVLLRGAAFGPGVDLNGDGDLLDTIRVYQPSNTRTDRFTFLTSLIFTLNENHRFRVGYTLDYGRHRQTGDFGYIGSDGRPISVFGGLVNGGVLDASGRQIQNRDRKSIAMLNQASAEYFGKFFQDRIEITAGLRAPFFQRDLSQYCYTQISTGNPSCIQQTPDQAGFRVVGQDFSAGGAAVPTNIYYAPFERTVKYSPILPSAGIAFNLGGPHSLYASYGRNFSAPSTDNLYRSVVLNPNPEYTDAFEGGYRLRGRKVQAQIAGYYTKYKNRIVTTTDADPTSPTFNTSIDRNVGSARSYGFDAQIAWQPVQYISLTPFVSYINSRLKDDITSSTGAIVASTRGAQFSETPKWQYGGRAQLTVAEFSAGAQFKHVGGRYATDDNGQTLAATTGAGQVAGTPFVLTGIAGAPISANGRLKGYDTLDLDAQVNLGRFGMPKTFLQFNVINVTNKYYFGNITTQSTLSATPRFRVGAPRTFQGTVRFAF